MYMDNNLIRNPCMELSQGHEIYNLATTFQFTFGGEVGETADGWEWCGDNGGQSNSYGGNLSSAVGTGCPYPNCSTSISSHVVSTNIGSTEFLKQTIEGNDLAELQYGTANAQSLTLSFWICASIPSVPLCFGLTGNPSNESNTNSNYRTYIQGYTTPSTAGTWKQYIFTIPGDTGQGLANWNLFGNNEYGLTLFFTTWANGDPTHGGAASLWTSTLGAWQNEGPGPAGTLGSRILGYSGISSAIVATLGATWNITGVKLEVGTFATPLYEPSVGELLDRCSRYIEKGVNVGQVTNNLNRALVIYQFPVGGVFYCFPSGRYAGQEIGQSGASPSADQIILPQPSANQIIGKTIPFKVKKAFNPTVVFSGANAFNGGNVHDVTNNQTVAIGITETSESGFTYTTTPNALGAINVAGPWVVDGSI